MKTARFRIEEIGGYGRPSLKVTLPVRLRSYRSGDLVRSCHANNVFVSRMPEKESIELFQTVRTSRPDCSRLKRMVPADYDKGIERAKKSILSVLRDISIN